MADICRSPRLAACPSHLTEQPGLTYQSGAGDAYLAAFDPGSGQRTGPGAYLSAGGHLPFPDVGGLAFAADGTAWVTYQSGAGGAYLAAFSPTTGQRTGPGAYLSAGGHLSFANVGGLAFAPDATAGPEPSAWAPLVAGFSVVGMGVRRQTRALPA